MGIRISGKHIDIGDVLRSQAESRLQEVVRKYVDSGYSGHVTVAKDGNGFKTECVLHFDHRPVVHVTGEAVDAYQSVNIAIEKVAKQLRRFKRKRDSHGVDKLNGYDFAALIDDKTQYEEEDDVIEVTGAGAVIIAEPLENAPLHSTASAVEAFEKASLPVLVFRNKGTQRVNVLYRRPDNHYGWVDIG